MLLTATTWVVVVSWCISSVHTDVDGSIPAAQQDNETALVNPGSPGGRAPPASVADGGVKVRRCESISAISMCRGVGYNATGWPNVFGHDSFADADEQLNTFKPLVQYGCAKHQLPFLLCAVYVPMCTEKVRDVIGPCRPICERVRRRCEPVLQNFGFPWPKGFNCSNFPARNDHAHMCMEGPDDEDDDDDDDDDVSDCSTSSGCKTRSAVMRPSTSTQSDSDDVDGKQGSQTSAHDCRAMKNRTGCREPCVWTGSTDPVVRVWMIVTATVCLISTLFSVVTYIIDSERYVYCERVVVFMAACSGLCATTLLVNLAVSPSTSLCRSPHSLHANNDCMIVFVILYYFSSSGASWWVMLNFLWMLTCGLHWTEASVRRLTTWFHVVAWALPAVLLVVVLVRHDVELDSLSRLCRVTRGTASELALVITPLVVYLAVGICSSLVGLVYSRLRGRAAGWQKDACVDDVGRAASEVLSVRVGVVSVVGGTTLACFTASLIYELAADARPSTAADADTDAGRRSEVAATVVRLISPLLLGVVSAPWMMLSGQASASWRTFIRRHCSSRQRATIISDTSRSTSGTTSSHHQLSHQLLCDERSHYIYSPRQSQQMIQQQIICTPCCHHCYQHQPCFSKLRYT